MPKNEKIDFFVWSGLSSLCRKYVENQFWERGEKYWIDITIDVKWFAENAPHFKDIKEANQFYSSKN